jgi:phage gp36-like protein
MSQYASITDLYRYGLNEQARGDLPDSVLTTALVTASANVDGHIGERFGAPLAQWTEEVTEWVCSIAMFKLMTGPRGMSSESGDYVVLKDRHDGAMSTLRRVQAQDYTPQGLVPQTSSGIIGIQPLVLSNDARGW